MAFVFRQKRRKGAKIVLSENWYVRFRDPLTRKIVTYPGYPDKEATQHLAARLVREAALHSEGMGPKPSVRKGGEPLSELLDRFEESLFGRTAQHVQMRMMHCRTVVRSLAWQSLRDLDSEKLPGFLADMRTRRSGRTVAHWLTSLKAFGNWLVRSKVTPANPFAGMSQRVTDQPHARRVLDAKELLRVFTAAGRSTDEYRGLNGIDRAVLYRVAAGTGLRSDELAALDADSFAFGKPATVRLAGQFTKNGEPVYLPLAPALVKVLMPWLAGRSGPLWPGTWNKRASEMLQLDLAAARIPYRTPAGVYDFHSLRSQFITDLGRAGVGLQAAQKLARHSDPKLTAYIYTRYDLTDLAAAVRKLKR